ncbi:cation transport ATPase [Thalassiosira pseudonana CCMP1335]|uniref:Cation transport ATPase n=1 Tax=Thalassiosira pseudonana TaxID=35128 RepID=B8BVH9_THAPS|nr:cation transport ATPase [Thalassiosira pseudonana CCMP1335]EED95465.1 cation transport ATPase [Thalassiosira pseudonana CCMP1335]
MQTAGRPLEDAVRTVLNLEAGDDKVTPLHIYVAKKILSSTSTTSTPSEILPPAHLPSPLPLLGLLSALLILIGGTILVPKWSVGTDVLLNYEQLKTDETTSWSTLQHWFDGQSEDEVDPYYQPKKPLSPAVLIHEGDLLNPKETICQLLLSPEYNGNLVDGQHRRYYFEFNQKRYYYDPSKSPSLISGGPSLHEESPSYLLSNDIIRGLCSNAKLLHAQERFGPYAHITIPVPTLSSAFAQRVSSPLVALQLLGRLLSILEDESIGKSLANLARLGIQHVSDAKRSIESAITLAKEVKDNEDIDDTEEKSRIWAVRPKDCNTTTKGHKSKNRSQWVQLSPTDLLPGDVFLIAPLETKKRAKSLIIPVDALLLEGTCVTEEAALTGESVPQAKVPLDLALDESQDEKTLDMNGHHRTSCVFAGTKLLHSANDDVGVSDMSSDSVSILSNLRTGTYSSRGEIIQALIRNKMNTGTLSNKDDEIVSMRLIGVLATFAVGACAYLFVDNPGDRRKDSVFKRIVQCTRIAVASVPSDLPVSLAASARQCAAVLREETYAVCSEPGALLESSKVDMIVFDKTGTLTADTQSLIKIVQPPSKSSTAELLSPSASDVVLAGCHTLIGMDDGSLVGDPLDKSSLESTGWKYNPHERSAASQEKPKMATDPVKLWQLRSFPFDPIRKMSSAIILVQLKSGDFRVWVVAKGAPTKMQPLFDEQNKTLTQWYGRKIQKLGTLGYRTRSNARSFHRNSIERQPSNSLEDHLSFVGFACFNAAMRVSTPRVIGELKAADLKVTMLTGDDLYASISAAKKAGIFPQPLANVHVLKVNASGTLEWEMNEQVRELSVSNARKIHRDISRGRSVLAATGNAVSAILSETEVSRVNEYLRGQLLHQASLIASASPDDKLTFVQWLKHSRDKRVANRVLVCGDGVNDIAAMREADVSVAMLSGFGHESEADESDVDVRPAASARIQLRIKKGLHKLQQNNSSNDPPVHATPLDVTFSSIQEELRRYKELKKGGSGAAKILEDEARLRRSLQQKADIDAPANEISIYESDGSDSSIKAGEACLASSVTLLRPCISGVETLVRTGVAAAACSISLYRKVVLNCMLSCYNLATLYKNGLRYGKWMWQMELAFIVFTERASFMSSSTPRPRLVADVRPATSPFDTAEVISTACQAIIHIVTLTLAVRHGNKLESFFLKSSPFQPNYVSNNVFFMSVFQNAVMALVNHPGRPFSVSFLESRPLCLSGVNPAQLDCLSRCALYALPRLFRSSTKVYSWRPFPQEQPKLQCCIYCCSTSRYVSCQTIPAHSFFATIFGEKGTNHAVYIQRNRPSRRQRPTRKRSCWTRK